MPTWTTPATWTTGNVLTAAQLNTQLRDNQTWLQDPPAAKIFTASTVVTSTSTPTTVPLGTVIYDNSTGSTMTGTTANKLTVPMTGLYLLTGSGVWDPSGTGAIRRIGFVVPGPTNVGVSLIQNGNTVTCEQATSFVAELTAADQVQLIAAQNSGSGLTLSNASLTMNWIGAG